MQNTSSEPWLARGHIKVCSRVKDVTGYPPGSSLLVTWRRVAFKTFIKVILSNLCWCIALWYSL